VWCAAGKGTFGTKELVGRIGSSGLASAVSHRKLVLPQLSAPGVAAHQVRELTGFRVFYGPIRSVDLPAFLDNELRATQEMRTKSFTMLERAALIPMELIGALKTGLAAMFVLFLLSLWGSAGQGLARAAGIASYPALAVLAAVVSGAVLTPLLLPWLPGRAFALKGACAGLAAFAVVTWVRVKFRTGAGALEQLGLLLLVTAFSSYYAMYFTGASTFTSLSGVKKEMRFALPLQIGAGVAGFALWVASLFTA
jgi:acetyl-CoA decarbonylase/synthase complex subunit gamma